MQDKYKELDLVNQVREELFKSEVRSPDEEKVINSTIYRLWKLGMLKKYKEGKDD